MIPNNQLAKDIHVQSKSIRGLGVEPSVGEAPHKTGGPRPIHYESCVQNWRIRVISVTGVSVITEQSRNWNDSVTNDGQYGHKIFDRGIFGHKSEYEEVKWTSLLKL